MKSDKIINIPNLSDDDLMNLPEIKRQIAYLNDSLDNICIESLKWNKDDFLCIFLSGVLGGLADILVGKPGGYNELKIKNNSLWGLGKKLKLYDLKNNPIDKQIPGIPVGDHRLYSYGHDLLRFIQGIRLILIGKGSVGRSSSEDILELAQAPENYIAPDSIWKAIIVLALHLYKDFWTARSLPIPGSTLIAELNNNNMPKWLDELTNDKEVNLRMLSGQALSISINELIPWLYLKIKYRSEDIANSMITEKLEKMKLLGHSVSLLFNFGKVITTKNPLLLNFGQIIRILSLAIKVKVDKSELRNIAIMKVTIQEYKNQLELLETLIITENAMVFTDYANRYVKNGMLELEDKIESSRLVRENQIALCKEKLDKFSEQTKQLEEK